MITPRLRAILQDDEPCDPQAFLRHCRFLADHSPGHKAVIDFHLAKYESGCSLEQTCDALRLYLKLDSSLT